MNTPKRYNSTRPNSMLERRTMKTVSRKNITKPEILLLHWLQHKEREGSFIYYGVHCAFGLSQQVSLDFTQDTLVNIYFQCNSSCFFCTGYYYLNCFCSAPIGSLSGSDNEL